MDLYEIDENKKMSHLLDVYSKRFKELFNTVPVIDDNDRSTLHRLIKALKVDKEKLAELILGFFELEDEFVLKSGFKLQFIDSRANAIAARKGVQTKVLYVVAMSESGFPVTSKNPNEFGANPKFKPVLWDDWIKKPEAKNWVDECMTTS